MLSWRAGLSLLMFFMVVGALHFYVSFASPATNAPEKPFLVHPGQSLAEVGAELAAQGYLEWDFSFVLYGRVTGASGKIHSGEYLLHQLSIKGIFDALTQGKVHQRRFTLVDGWNFRDLRSALLQAEALETGILQLPEEEILRRLEMKTTSLEGWFFPDTYYYVRGDDAQGLLKRAYERMQMLVDKYWEERAPGLPLRSAEEAVILASIVEKETGMESDRALIASVFVNRLRKGMKLQTDPTVIYGLGEDFDGDLRRRDLEAPGPYNSYLNFGLPPTPIAFPGLNSLLATLFPQPSDLYYFVAKGNGETYFSRTLKEHEEAVRRYQLGER